jgi:hypothetical protein
MRNRLLMGVVATVLMMPQAVWGQVSASAQADSAGPVAKSAASEKDSAVRLLRKPVTDKIDWNEVSFEYVVNWLKEQGDVNIVANWRALSVAGVERESVVTLALNRTTVGEVLNEVIEQLSETEPVLYRGKGNIIRISTQDDFNRKLELRTYDVTDILVEIPDFYDAPEIDLEQQQQSGGQSGQQGTPVFSGGSGSDERDDEGGEELRERMEELVTLIENTIEPTSWDYNGGQGTVQFFNRMLVIRNSIEVHEQIAGFFEADR